jgi:branched-chain amino acid transport system substrate-binding protein
MKTAGLEKAKGDMSVAYLKDPTNPAWANDRGMQEWLSFMSKYNSGAPTDGLAAYGTSVAQTVAQLLKQCGDDLSRENILRQTMRLDMDLPLLLPGTKLSTSEKNRHPLKDFRLQKFDGTRWNLLTDA